MITGNVDLSQSHEYFFVSMSMLYLRDKTNVIPEIMQVITPNQMMQLVQLYGGKTLQLPSPRELSITLKASLFIYYTDFLHNEEADVIESLDLRAEELTAVRRVRDEWYQDMKKQGGASYLNSIKECINAG